jgi:hypothetical protein
MDDDNELTIVEMPPRARKLRKKRQVKRRAAEQLDKRAARMVRAAQRAGPFAGMTQMNCCDGCRPDFCVISEMAYCAHPYKGGLHRVSQTNPAALARLNGAKEFLGPPKRL